MQPLRPLAAFGRPAPSGGGFPPIPDISNFTGIFSLYGIAPDWVSATNPLLSTSVTSLFTNTTSPNIADYSTFALNAGNSEAEQMIEAWVNQAPSPASSEIVFTASPYLRIATPFIVSGAGTSARDGVYLYDGVGDDKAQYEKSGGILGYDAGDGRWELLKGASPDYRELFNSPFYPQGLTWSTGGGTPPAPTVAMSTVYADQAGWIDSVAPETPVGTFNISSYTNVNACTVFVKFRVQDAVTDQVIVATASAGAGRNGFVLYVSNGELFVQQFNADGLLQNTKKVSISANTWYLVSAVFDRTRAAANQTRFWLNGSSAGQTSVVADDLTGTQLRKECQLYTVDGAVNFYDGDLTEIWTDDSAFGDTLRQETQTRLAAQYPIVTLS